MFKKKVWQGAVTGKGPNGQLPPYIIIGTMQKQYKLWVNGQMEKNLNELDQGGKYNDKGPL